MKTTPRYEVKKHISRIKACNAYSSSQASLALLDRDQIDTLVTTYAMSPSSYGEHHLPTTSIFPLYRLSSVVFSSWQSFFFTSFACSGYRYGSDSYRNQGQEKDDEVKGKGNSVNYTYRMHDPRLGRFFAVDPLTSSYPMLTPYQFCSNSPVYLVEIEGLEGGLPAEYTIYTVYSTDEMFWYLGGREQGKQSTPNIGYLLPKYNGGEMWVVRPFTKEERKFFKDIIEERRGVTEKNVGLKSGFLVLSPRDNSIGHTQVEDKSGNILVHGLIPMNDFNLGSNVLTSSVNCNVKNMEMQEFSLPLTAGGGSIDLNFFSNVGEFAVEVLDKQGKVLLLENSENNILETNFAYPSQLESVKVRVSSKLKENEIVGTTMAVGPWNTTKPFPGGKSIYNGGSTTVTTSSIQIKDNPKSSPAKPINNR